ncbi:hypothetical protein [Photobacterium sp. TY1-4]|uniref:hypothetical protein n=1 Tax=Photobacterium sp. TY1-4 TaxID=2899122 RepID=UPI0021C08C64|nr:hypothetical protein [Photobacterium sp. TY1-4]UXI04428.1 hypothetical protein NH461_20290 [Photobacterium sp. TY1-4]
MILLVVCVGLGVLAPASAHLATAIAPQLVTGPVQQFSPLAGAQSEGALFDEAALDDPRFVGSHVDATAGERDFSAVPEATSVFPSSDTCSKAPPEQDNHHHSSSDRQLDPALFGSSRMALGCRDNADEPEPQYLLVFELPIEPAPSFAVGYRIDFHATLDWTRRVIPPAGRVAGWKDSNQLYQPHPHHFSLVR